MIIAPDDFQDLEYAEPKAVFEENNYKVETCSKGTDIAFGKYGAEVKIDIELSKVKVENFNAIVFVGGPGAYSYIEDEEIISLVHQAVEEEKLICAICIAPMILYSAGILQGKRVTVWDGDSHQSTALLNSGIEYTGEDVTVDENLITANGPDAAEKFGEEIVKKLEM